MISLKYATEGKEILQGLNNDGLSTRALNSEISISPRFFIYNFNLIFNPSKFYQQYLTGFFQLLLQINLKHLGNYCFLMPFEFFSLLGTEFSNLHMLDKLSATWLYFQVFLQMFFIPIYLGISIIIIFIFFRLSTRHETPEPLEASQFLNKCVASYQP